MDAKQGLLNETNAYVRQDSNDELLEDEDEGNQEEETDTLPTHGGPQPSISTFAMPRASLLENKSFLDSVNEAKSEWPRRAERYLHKVRFQNKNGDQEAFCGWPDPDNEEDQKFTSNRDAQYRDPKTQKTRPCFSNKEKDGSNRRIVFVDIKIKRVSDIDTGRECFRTVFHYYLTWLATFEEYKEYTDWENSKREQEQRDDQAAEWVPSWVPNIDFANATEINDKKQIGPFKMKRGDHDSYKSPTYETITRKPRRESFMRQASTENLPLTNKKKQKLSWDIYPEQLGFDPRYGYWIRVQYEADVVFSEQLELESFPFDCQDFTMLLKIVDKGYKEADLLPFPRAGDFLTLDSQFSVTSEWKIRNVIVEFYFTDPKDSKSLQSYSTMAIRIKASRVWASYVTEFVITFCMFALGLGTFALEVDPSELGNRLAYCVVFLLADVSTLQLVGQKLPEIQYMTILDEYTFSCFLFLFLVTLWSCIAGASKVVAPHDGTAFWIFFTIFIAFQIFSIVRAWYSRRWERQKLVKTGEELQKQNERNVCCNLCCLRGGQAAITLTWEREEFVGEVQDLFVENKTEKKQYNDPGDHQLVAFGNATEYLRHTFGGN